MNEMCCLVSSSGSLMDSVAFCCENCGENFTFRRSAIEASAVLLLWNFISATRKLGVVGPDFQVVRLASARMLVRDLFANDAIVQFSVSMREKILLKPESSESNETEWAERLYFTTESRFYFSVLYLTAIWLSAKLWCPRLYQLPLSQLLKALANIDGKEDSATTMLLSLEPTIQQMEIVLLRCSNYAIPVEVN